MADHLAPVYAQWPIDVVDASGVHLHTRDGRRILDLYGGHAVAALGYSHPRWLAALEKQARSLLFQSNAVPLAVRSRAAMRLSHFAGLGLNTVFFVNTGAEANENALKLALRITGRRKVVAVEGGFHGRTAAAGAVTWGAAKKWYGFPQMPFDVEFIPRGDVDAIARVIGTDTAAVIVEPVQGVAGAVDLGAVFLGCTARPMQRDLLADDLRRSAVRHGPHRLSVRGQHARYCAGHDHDSQGARCGLSLLGAADGGPRRRAPEDGRPRHHVRRRAARLCADRGGRGHHRVRRPARQRVPPRAAAARDLRRRAGRVRAGSRPARRASYLVARQRTCSANCSSATS